ncbi:MAG: glycosyltransferase family 2 protein [Deltaproteobacteria bacterium]|nr:glycosyltransferase family 2 protein [Deltaproteobacteria bacterium]
MVQTSLIERASSESPIRVSDMKLAIYIPSYNHAATIPIVLDRIPEEIRRVAAEIFIVDDASPDNTYLVGLGYAAHKGMANLRVYRNDRNCGYGGSQKFAYQYCIDNGFDLVVMLHGDAQYAPEKIPYLLEPFTRGEADMVFGSRMTGDPRAGGMPLHRYLGNIFLTKVENWVLGWNLSEYHSGYRVYSCEALKRVPFQKCSDVFHFDSEVLVQFAMAGLRVVERTIPTYYGDEKCGVNVWRYGIDVLHTMAEYWLHKRGWRYTEKFNVTPVISQPTPVPALVR